MAGTRTAPAFTAPVSKRVITLHLIDASGDLWAEDWEVPVAEVAADIEAYAAAYAAATQSSLYAISDNQQRIGAALSSNAEAAAQRNSVKDGVNLLFGNTSTFKSRTLRVIAPVESVMSGNLDIPIVGSGLLDTLITATIAVSTVADFFDSGQYTERRERKNNPRVSS